MSIAADLRALARLRPEDARLTALAARQLLRARRRLRSGALAEILERAPALKVERRASDPARAAAAVRRVDRIVPGEDRCLVASVALRELLAAEGCAVELHIGVRRGDTGLDAHAWVERDGEPLLEPGRVGERFARLAPASR